MVFLLIKAEKADERLCDKGIDTYIITNLRPV